MRTPWVYRVTGWLWEWGSKAWRPRWCSLESCQCRGKTWGGRHKFRGSTPGCTADVIDRNLYFISIRPTLDIRNFYTDMLKGIWKKGLGSLGRQQADQPAACPGSEENQQLPESEANRIKRKNCPPLLSTPEIPTYETTFERLCPVSNHSILRKMLINWSKFSRGQPRRLENLPCKGGLKELHFFSGFWEDLTAAFP